jgi:hypothetical protein
MSVNIIFPIEIPNRELMYKSCLAAQFARKGLNCYLSLKQHVPFLLDKLSPCLYFDKGYHSGISEKLHGIVKKNGGLIVSLDEEGAIDFPDFFHA